MTPERAAASRPASGRARAIVIGLESVTGLQSARILARRGVPVIGLTDDRGHYCSRTRVCERILELDTSSEQLIETLAELGRQFAEKPVLFPCTDASVLLISRHRERLLPWLRVVLPSHEIVELLVRKVSFYAYAAEHGLPIPPTFFLRTPQDAEEAAERLAYPAVVKPSMRTPEWGANLSEKGFKVENGRQLREVYARVGQWCDVLIAQEWIPGSEANLYTCNCYFDAESRPLVSFVSRKLRQWPPDVGIGSLGVECRNDAVEGATLQLFGTVGWCGLGYLEMKRHEITGEHLIVEPNVGRPTGRSAMAEAAGVELLYTQYCDASGLPLPANRTQRFTGVKWIHTRCDLQSAYAYWRRGELTFRAWARSMRGRKVDAVISRRDPAPMLYEALKGGRVVSGREPSRRRPRL